ncbi:MAG: rhomboid family intramembrane serine protease [Prevotellaceae bacterium]|jgi:membrane associated rhomboid family serine protease|nr:rhomboid family intramembrane serine protease [Prevotellaceae bacterium]
MDVYTLVILVVTSLLTIVGFRNRTFFCRYLFSTDAILRLRQWDRIVSSAFLHADWMHLLFNMLTFYFFAPYLTASIGALRMLLIYFSAIIGGNLLSLFAYRRDSSYTAVGASGGVTGVLYAAIALDPHIGIMIMFIPIAIPGWLFAILYLLYSLYGMRTSLGNIGHTAHLGGALVGFALALGFYPELFMENILFVGLIALPLLVFGYMLLKNNHNKRI